MRGADLLASTPRQIFLQQALGLPMPRYLHVPIAMDARGNKLEDVKVTATSLGGNVNRTARTDKNGRYEAAGLPPIDWRL